MILKLLLAAALASASVSQANAADTSPTVQPDTVDTSSEPSPYFLDSSTLVQVLCPTTIDGEPAAWAGTAFYIGDGKFVTARHVVRDESSADKHFFETCTIDDKPIKVLQVGKGFVDYALISAPIYPPYRAVYSCEGMKQSRTYYATGYADGNPWLVTQRLIGTGSKSYMPGPGNNEDILRGSTIDGQSGGPVSDTDGVIVGIVSAGANDSEVLSLADTPICKKGSLG